MERLDFLKDILTSGFVGTQDELCDKLSRQGYDVTQSTISRDLRRLGAVKAIDEEGRTVYRFTADTAPPVRNSALARNDHQNREQRRDDRDPHDSGFSFLGRPSHRSQYRQRSRYACRRGHDLRRARESEENSVHDRADQRISLRQKGGPHLLCLFTLAEYLL